MIDQFTRGADTENPAWCEIVAEVLCVAGATRRLGSPLIMIEGCAGADRAVCIY